MGHRQVIIGIHHLTLLKHDAGRQPAIDALSQHLLGGWDPSGHLLVRVLVLHEL